jgi:hypothetical protein
MTYTLTAIMCHSGLDEIMVMHYQWSEIKKKFKQYKMTYTAIMCHS